MKTLFFKDPNNLIPDITKDLKSRREITDGIEPKFWISYKKNEYLFKHDFQNNNILFGEVFVSALCHELGIKCVEASFAKCKFDNRFITGALIASYNDEDVVENISLSRVRQAVQVGMETKTPGSYSPDEILADLNVFAGDKCEIVDSVRQDLVVMALFDYLTSQVDRHRNNIEFLVRKTSERLELSVAPMFDNGRCFGFADIFNNDKRKAITGRNNILIMDQDYNKSVGDLFNYANGIAKEMTTNPHLRQLFDRIKQLDMETFLDDFMQATGESVDEVTQYNIVATWKHKIQNVENAIKNLPEVQAKIEIEHEKRRRAQVKLEVVDSYLNYYYDKVNGVCKNSFFEYEIQEIEYVDQFKAWRVMKTQTVKTIDDYPLLKPRCSGDEKAFYLGRIRKEREKRESEILDFKNKFLTPNYLELEMLQQKKENRLKFELQHKGEYDDEIMSDMWRWSDECSQVYDDYQKKDDMLYYWIAYGDAYGKKPTLESLGVDTSKKYDEDVMKEYIDKHSLHTCLNYGAYCRWLDSVGLSEYAAQTNLDQKG